MSDLSISVSLAAFSFFTCISQLQPRDHINMWILSLWAWEKIPVVMLLLGGPHFEDPGSEPVWG